MMKERLFRGDTRAHERASRKDFDPVAEGQRYGLSPEASTALWEHARQQATSGDGKCDEHAARARFAKLAELAAYHGDPIRPLPFHWTRVDVTSGRAPPDNPLVKRVTGKTTRVLSENPEHAHVVEGVPGRTTMAASQTTADVSSPEVMRAVLRRCVSSGHAACAKLARAIAERNHCAAVNAITMLKQDLTLARRYFGSGLAHDEELEASLAALEGQTEPLFLRLPNMSAGDQPWDLWGSSSAEWRAASSQAAHAEGSPSIDARAGKPRVPERLPASMRWIENAFGRRFDDVELHRDSVEVRAGQRAVTRGQHIHLAPGAVDLTSPRGKLVLAHELAHVAQQDVRGSRVGTRQELEREASQAATQATRGHTARISLRAEATAAYAFSEGHEPDELDHSASDAASADQPTWDGSEPQDSEHVAAPALLGQTVRLTMASTAALESTPGRPLDSATRAHFERALNADLSTIRIHEDQAVESRGAKALADGEHLHFRPGAYAPSSVEGREILGHELIHVLRSRAGHAPLPQDKGGIVLDAGLEREADELGTRAARGEAVRLPGGERATTARRGIVQPKLAVSIHASPGENSATARIEAIDIAGRPERKRFPRPGGGSTEGDHTTAWAVIRLGVSNRLCGKSLSEAVAETEQLVAEAEKLPGTKRAVDKERGDFTTRVKDVLATKGAASRTSLVGVSVAAAQSALQQYIAAYLTYRNSLPLSAMHIGRATGDGEANPLKVIQYWEKTWSDENEPTDSEQQHLIAALGALFSPKVIEKLPEAAPANLPGMENKEDPKTLENALKSQHIASLRTALPNLSTRLDFEKTTLGKKWDGKVPDAAQDLVTGSAFAVQLSVDSTGTITHALPSGRPKHGSVGGLEGDHTTAYVVSTFTIVQAVLNQKLNAAVDKLKIIEGVFRSMPGTDDTRKQRMTEERLVHLHAADEATKKWREKATENPTLSAVQAYAGALLYYRNSLALTVVGAETTSTGKGEAAKMKKLAQLETTLEGNETNNNNKKKRKKERIKATELVEVVAGLFDSTVTDKVLEVTKHNHQLVKSYELKKASIRSKSEPDEAKEVLIESLEDDQIENLGTPELLYSLDDDEQAKNSRKDLVPGYIPGETTETFFGAVFQQHLQSIRQLAPLAFGQIDADIAKHVVTKLVGDNIVDVDSVVKAIQCVLSPASEQLVEHDFDHQAKAKEKDEKKMKGKHPSKLVDFSKKKDDDYLDV